MEKNNFLIYNDIVYTLYQCKSYEALRDEFLPRLRLLIPFTYASIISVNPENRTEIVPTPVSAFLIISMKQNCSTSII